MARTAKPDKKITITCPYCKKHKLTVRIDAKVGFFTDVACGNRLCRIRFQIRLTAVTTENISYTYTLRGIDLYARIPWHGLVSTQKSKVSGEFVAVYRAKDLGFSGDGFVLVCVKHDMGNLGFTDSFSNVLKWQGKPNYWCKGCKKEHPVPQTAPAEELPKEDESPAE